MRSRFFKGRSGYAAPAFVFSANPQFLQGFLHRDPVVVAHPQGARAQGRTHRTLVLKGAETLATSGIEGYVALNVGGKDNAAPRLAEDRLAAQRL